MVETSLDALFDLICPDSAGVELSPEQEDRLGWLCDDDEEQQAAVLKVIAVQKFFMPKPVDGPISASHRDQLRETSELCLNLGKRIETEWLKLSRALSLLGEYYAIRSQKADPAGKRSRKSRPAEKLAELLVILVHEKVLDLELRVHPDSDLAKLFRLCCEISGIEVPQNAAYYLKPQIDQLKAGANGRPGLGDLEQISLRICSMLNIKYPPFVEEADGIHDEA